MTTGQLEQWPSRAPARFRRWHGLEWAWAVAALALAAVGGAGGSRILLVGGVVGAAVPAALAWPELVLGLFLFAGGIKGAPWLQGLPFDLTIAAAVGVCAAMVASVHRSGIGAAARTPAIALAAAITALVLLTTLWSPDPAGGLSKALRFLFLTMLAFAAPLLLIRSRSSLVRLMMSVVGFALLLALTAASTNNLSNGARVIAGGTEIELGIYSAFGLLVAVSYLTSVGPRRWRAWWLVPGIFLAVTVLTAGSRGALVSTTLALLFVWSRVARSTETRVIGLGVVVALAFLLATGAGGIAGQAATRYEQSLFTTNTSKLLGGGRSSLFKDGWQIAVAHPLGIGTAGFNAVTGGGQYPHNIILELGAEQGLIGVALFAALLVAAWRGRRRIPFGPRSPEAVLTGGLIVLFFVESLFSEDINGDRLLWFALGLAFAAKRMRSSAQM